MKGLQETIRAILRNHVGSTCTAAVVRVQRDEEVLLEVARGATDLTRRAPITVRTPFDLASLTKVFTASAVLRLVDRGRLGLDDPVHAHLTGFLCEGKEQVTVRQLLTHTSGLPRFGGLYRTAETRARPRRSLLQRKLERAPGAAVVYSDAGFLILGLLLEEAAGMPLDRTVLELVVNPLRLRGVSYFGPRGTPATEDDPWRGWRIRGEVHDENAWILGGVAGHAGLFGPAGAVAALARAYASPTSTFLSPQLRLEAIGLQAQTGAERRGLGWKLASTDPDYPDSVFSASAFGHTGFTGTAVWTDPELDVTTVLLTNRVYFGRDPGPIARFRRDVFTAVVDRCQER